MNVKMLSNFSVLKAFTDTNKDILECLLPFVEYAIVQIGTEYQETIDIKSKIYEHCSLDIPVVTLKTLLKKLKRLNLITDFERTTHIRVVAKSATFSGDYMEKTNSFSRDVHMFVEDCKQFCGFTDDITEDNIYKFIQVYQHNIDISNGNVDFANSNIEQNNTNQLIAKYLLHISECSNQHFTTFKNIFYGYILSQFVAGNTDIAHMQKKLSLSVYVDSNFLLRVLDMQAPPYYLASTELLNLMKHVGIRIVALPEIIAEVRVVLNNNFTNYIARKPLLEDIHGKKVEQLDGVIGAFFRQKKSIAEIDEYISNLEKSIESLGIIVAPETTALPSSYDTKEQLEIAELKEKNNNVESISSIDQKEHVRNRIIENSILDSRILYFIRQKRRYKISRLDAAKYLFLTCDNTICNVNSYYHKPNRTIPEAISEGALTNALFMSDLHCDNNAPIALLLSIFKSSSYLNFDILRQFHHDLNYYIQKNPEDQQYLASILSNQNLFANIELLYDDGAETAEEQELKALFDEARCKDEQNKCEHEIEKSDMQEQINQLTQKIEVLNVINERNSARQEHSSQAMDVDGAQSPNFLAEKFFKLLLVGICVCLIGISLLFLVLTCANNIWETTTIFYATPLVFAGIFTYNLLQGDILRKLINIHITKQSTDSTLQILLIAVLKSLSALLLPVVGIILELINA